MDFPNKAGGPNPKKGPQPEKPKIQQVIHGGAKKAKRPLSKRMFDFIFAENPREISSQIGRDIVVPRIKMGLEDAIRGFLHSMLWGGATRPPDGITRGNTFRNVTSYHTMSANPSPLNQAQQMGQARNQSGNYEDVICPDLQTAEALLAEIVDRMQQYNLVSVGDLYEAAGLPTSISDNAYGWTNLFGARISKTRDGFVLELPRPTLIT